MSWKRPGWPPNAPSVTSQASRSSTLRAVLCSSRNFAEAVVLLIKTAPLLNPAKAPFPPSTTLLNSSSFPTHTKRNPCRWRPPAVSSRYCHRTCLLPFGGLRCGAVVDSNVVTALNEMSCHRIAHHAQTNKCDFYHFGSPVLLGTSLASLDGHECSARIVCPAHKVVPKFETRGYRAVHRHGLHIRQPL